MGHLVANRLSNKKVQSMMLNSQVAEIIGTPPRAKLWAFVLLAFVFYSSTALAMNFNPTSVKGMAQAYGFVHGQEYSLSRITKEFPELTGAWS